MQKRKKERMKGLCGGGGANTEGVAIGGGSYFAETSLDSSIESGVVAVTVLG